MGFSQRKEIKDAVYIIFKESENQVKETPQYSKPLRELDPIANYMFYFDDKHRAFFNFYHSEYLNMDSIDAGVKTEVITVKKSFLKEHKEDVLTMDDFLKLGIAKSYSLFHYYSKVYIIDKSEIKKGKVTMYQVGLYSTYMPGI